MKDQALQGEDGIQALRDALDRLHLQGRDKSQESDDDDDDDDDDTNDDHDESEVPDEVEGPEPDNDDEGVEARPVGEVEGGVIEVASIGTTVAGNELDEQKFVVVVEDVDKGSDDVIVSVEEGSNEEDCENESKRLEPETADTKAENKSGKSPVFSRKPSVRKSAKKSASKSKPRQPNNQRNTTNVKK